tara:strand:+ start:525 stop:692 length:168 start_codon:yes stop_codon:yes gene_type:complete
MAGMLLGITSGEFNWDYDENRRRKSFVRGRSALEVVICGVIKSGICDHNEELARE